MRRTFRLLASVKPVRYLEPGAPTGLTGLWTHRNPRSTLLYLYSSTLDKLTAFPESSLYRQSVEALTKHRLALVEQTVPPGYDEWSAKTKKSVSENPDQFTKDNGRGDGSGAKIVTLGGRTFIVGTEHEAGDIRVEEWDGRVIQKGHVEGEGPDQAVDVPDFKALSDKLKELNDTPKQEQDVDELEPQLTADQVSELETKIGAGLIEEVVQVAESELKLVDVLLEAKVWEDLEEKPVEGQWAYFERNSM